MRGIICAVTSLLFSAVCAASNVDTERQSLDSAGTSNLSCTSVIATHQLVRGTNAYSAALDFNSVNSAMAPGLLKLRLPQDPEFILVTVNEPVACGEHAGPNGKWECETLGCTEEIFGTGHMAPGTKLSMETCGDGGRITITWTRNSNGSWTVTAVSAEQHTSCGPMD